MEKIKKIKKQINVWVKKLEKAESKNDVKTADKCIEMIQMLEMEWESYME